MPLLNIYDSIHTSWHVFVELFRNVYLYRSNLLTKRDRESHKVALKRLGNFVHKTHIVFENLSNINGDMLQKTKMVVVTFYPILIPKIFTCTALTFKGREIESRAWRRSKDY